MYIIALTGGIGSGKSTAAKAFQAHGIDVIDTDHLARDLTAPGTPALNALTEHFGRGILNDQAALDRAALRTRIFQNPEDKRWLEKLLHPRIREACLHAAAQSQSPYCIWVIPLLYRRDRYPVDRILSIETTHQQQVMRTVQRDALNAEQVERIIAQQPTPETRQALADDLIQNEGSHADLRAKVAALHRYYLQEARKKGAA